MGRTLRLLTESCLLFEAAVNVKQPDWKAVLIVSCTFVAAFLYDALLHPLIGQHVLSRLPVVHVLDPPKGATIAGQKAEQQPLEPAGKSHLNL